jgi:ankyrin repeat protein
MIRYGENKSAKSTLGNTKESEEMLIAAKRSNWRKVKEIIKNYPACINYKPKNGDPLLIIACEKSNLKMVEFALNNKADVRLTGCNGWSALMEVSMQGKIKYIQKLLDHGAPIDFGRKDVVLTPLMTACMGLKKDAAILLIQNGANFHLKSNSLHYRGTILQMLQSDSLLQEFPDAEEIIKIIETAKITASSIITLLQISNLTTEILDKNLQSIKDSSAPFYFNPLTLILDEKGKNIGHYLMVKKEYWPLINHLQEKGLSLHAADSNNVTVKSMHLKNQTNIVVERFNKNIDTNISEMITDYLETKDKSAVVLVASTKQMDTKLIPNSSPILIGSKTLDTNIDKDNFISQN